MKKNIIIMIVLGIILMLCVGYIVYDNYSSLNNDKEMQIFQNGALYGYEQAIIQMVDGVSKCQPVPITYGNQTINIIAIECYQE